MITHYPVSTRFWRGVRGAFAGNRTLRRACDWKPAAPEECSYDRPICRYCHAYRENLRRLGRA